MRGFCGWFSQCQTHLNPIDAVAGMARGSLSASVASAENWAIKTLQEKSDDLVFYTTDTDFVVIDGNPKPGDQKFSELVGKHDLAKACLIRYREVGTAFLLDLEGAFSLAICLDNGHRSLLARDRIGINPLYYATGNDGLAFSTNLNYLYGSSDLDLTVDRQSIYDYLYFHVIPSPRTIYQGVYCLEPGSYLEATEGRNHSGRYWQIAYSRERSSVDVTSLETEFMDILRCCVQSEVSPDHEVGCFLSGGTDSSTLAGILSDVSQQSVRTYSIGFDQEGFDEMEYARLAARHFGTQHHEYYVTPEDIVNLVPKISRVYGQPFGNSSVVPTYFCAQMARADGVTKLLGGDGGDELFGGNKRYATQVLFSYYERIPSAVRKMLVEPVVNGFPFGEHVAPVRKVRRYIEQAQIPMPDRLHTYAYLDLLGRDVILDPGFFKALNIDLSMQSLRQVYADVNATHVINKMAGLDLKITLADNDLPKVGGMCDLAGVAVGYPFLQPAMVDFSARLPADLKVHRRKIRYFFKNALSDYLPKQIIDKKKHGFGLPFGDWLVSHAGLRSMAFDSLGNLKKREIVRADFIDDLRDRRLAEHPNYYGGLIWALMILEQFLDSNSHFWRDT